MEVPLHLPSLPLYATQQLLKRNKIFYLIFIYLAALVLDAQARSLVQPENS